MFRAEILWFADGPTLKMEGRLVGQWAEQARCLVTTDVVPKGLMVDLTEVSYVDAAGERLLSWLGRVGALFVATSVYAITLCERLGLSPTDRTQTRRHGSTWEKSSIAHFHVEVLPGQHQKEEE